MEIFEGFDPWIDLIKMWEEKLDHLCEGLKVKSGTLCEQCAKISQNEKITLEMGI